MPQDDQVYISVVKQDIVKYDVTLRSLVQEIRECNCNQVELDELVLQVRTRINYLREQIAELKRLAQEQDSEESKASLNDEVSRCEKLLQDNHKSFRNATLAAQLTINQRSKDDLLGEADVDDNKLRNRESMAREMMLKKSSNLTDDLLTVTRMIKENTDKSGKTVDRLVESSQMIGNTQEELKSMGSVIGQARKILSKYGRRENTDKLLIFIGLVFFLASCLVVIRNRFIF